MARRSRIKFTYEDYRSLPESETKRYELLEGELVMVPSPTLYHQDVLGNLYLAISLFVRDSRLGRMFVAPCDVVLSEDTVLQPDIVFVSRERSHIMMQDHVRGAPDLVIEVLSPSTADRDRRVKRGLYAQYGVKECWIVDPDRKTIEVLALGELGFRSIAVYGEQQTLHSPVLDGLAMPLSEVFGST